MLHENHLYAKASKCDFLKTNIHYLGHVISNKGIEMDLDKFDAIVQWLTPKNTKYV